MPALRFIFAQRCCAPSWFFFLKVKIVFTLNSTLWRPCSLSSCPILLQGCLLVKDRSFSRWPFDSFLHPFNSNPPTRTHPPFKCFGFDTIGFIFAAKLIEKTSWFLSNPAENEHGQSASPENPCRTGKNCTIDLLVLTSTDQPLLNMKKIVFFCFTKRAVSRRRSSVLKPFPQVRFPWWVGNFWPLPSAEKSDSSGSNLFKSRR